MKIDDLRLLLATILYIAVQTLMVVYLSATIVRVVFAQPPAAAVECQCPR